MLAWTNLVDQKTATKLFLKERKIETSLVSTNTLQTTSGYKQTDGCQLYKLWVADTEKSFESREGRVDDVGGKTTYGIVM